MESEEPTDLEAVEPPAVDAALAGSAPETVNLVAKLKPDDLKKYGEDVCRFYEVDHSSSEDFRSRRANIVKLYLGQMPPPPEDGFTYARVHYPIVATAVNRMHARIYDQQFPSSGEYFGVKPTDQNDLDRAVRVAKHLNWQCLHQIPEYVPNHDSLIMQWLLYGSAFTIVYWDPIRKRPCHEVCRTEDIVINYDVDADGDPHIGRADRITRVLRKYRRELEKLAEVGYYDPATVALLYTKDVNGQAEAPAETRDASTPMRDVIDQESGVKKPAEESGNEKPRVILEQHCWCELDGVQRPVIMAVDKATKQCLGIFVREDEDPVDRARFNREEAANQAAHQAAMAQWEMDLQSHYSQTQVLPSPQLGAMSQPPMPGPTDMTQPPEAGLPGATQPPMPGATDASMPMGAPPGLPTPPPPEPPPPEQPKMIPINFFTHYICMPNPEGFYGIGIGSLLEGNNLVADTLAAQLVDAGTLANTFTFLFDRNAKMPRGDLKIKPGQGTEAESNGRPLKDMFLPITFTPPNAQLAAFIKDQKEEAEGLSGANEVLSGEVGGSNETATTTQIRISQALAAIAILNKRYTRARSAEASLIARLNSVYLEDVQYFYVVDPAAKDQTGKTVVNENKVARMDYLQDTDITVTADPRMASQPQRIAEAQTALQAIMGSPITAADPLMVALGQKGLFQAMDRPDLIAGLDQMMTRVAQQMQMGMQPGAPSGGPPAPGQGPGPKGPTGPAVPMPKRVPNAGPTPTNGEQNGQVQ